MRLRCGRIALLALTLTLALAGCASGAANSVTHVATPTATVTAAPSATFTAPTTGDLLAANAQGAVGAAARSLTTAYDASAEKLTVTIIIAGDVPDTDAKIAVAYARVKTLCFQEENALWTSGQPLRQVTVVILGPTQDEYDTIVNQWYGIVVVNQTTARKFSWASATPESAWNVYDQTFLRQSFVVFDEIPPAPPMQTATPTH